MVEVILKPTHPTLHIRRLTRASDAKKAEDGGAVLSTTMPEILEKS
jgi:hypothetical protein